MFRKEEFQFLSADESTNIRGVRWIPENGPVAVVLLAHGMTEHIDRYEAFAEFLTANDILVIGHDHLGHGASVKSDDDLGYFAEEDGDEVLVEDMYKILLKSRKEYPMLPHIMFGHSMGSFLTRLMMSLYGDALDGAILCGTGNVSEKITKFAMRLCKIMAKFKGWRYRSEKMNEFMFGAFNKKFAPNRTEMDWLSRNDASVDAYIADKKCGFIFTLNGYYNLFRMMWKVTRNEYILQMPKYLPVLFISGEQDPVGDFGKGVQAAVKQFDQAGMMYVSSIMYKDDRHELLEELDREQVYEDVLKWLKKYYIRYMRR